MTSVVTQLHSYSPISVLLEAHTVTPLYITAQVNWSIQQVTEQLVMEVVRGTLCWLPKLSR